MLQTFANLPSEINETISDILSQTDNSELISSAKKLHSSYMERSKDDDSSYIQDNSDVLAYLGLRTPATYAQIHSSLLNIKELFPSWEPCSLLDLGCGPGTGSWAAKTIWPSLKTVTNIDQEEQFIKVGEKIIKDSKLKINSIWRHQNILTEFEIDNYQKYDIIIIANVLNELPEAERVKFLMQAYNHCSGVMIIIEPGTPFGFQIVQEAASEFSGKAKLLAPYINNSFIQSDTYWIHFPQRFIRPEFQRQIRHNMRQSDLMASDWEVAKYSYVAIGAIEPEEKIWVRCIGPIKKQKGFLEMPILTQEGITLLRVMKRDKKEYAYAKDLQWGQGLNGNNPLVKLL